MQCSKCIYWFPDGGSPFPFCHWVDKYPGDLAPCEYDDDEEEKEDNE